MRRHEQATQACVSDRRCGDMVCNGWTLPVCRDAARQGKTSFAVRLVLDVARESGSRGRRLATDRASQKPDDQTEIATSPGDVVRSASRLTVLDSTSAETISGHDQLEQRDIADQHTASRLYWLIRYAVKRMSIHPPRMSLVNSQIASSESKRFFSSCSVHDFARSLACFSVIPRKASPGIFLGLSTTSQCGAVKKAHGTSGIQNVHSINSTMLNYAGGPSKNQELRGTSQRDGLSLIGGAGFRATPPTSLLKATCPAP